MFEGLTPVMLKGEQTTCTYTVYRYLPAIEHAIRSRGKKIESVDWSLVRRLRHAKF
jgi:hypothetical protein